MLNVQANFLSSLMDRATEMSPAPVQQGVVTACSGATIHARGFHYPIGYGAKIICDDGNYIAAEVSGFSPATTILTPYQQNPCLRTGARVESVRNDAGVAVGDSLLGRIIDPLGDPLDGYGPLSVQDRWPLEGSNINVLNRGSVTNQLDVGVRAIDALLPMGQGQRVALIAGSGIGKSVLIQQITMGTKADIIVVGLIGERAREVSDFVAASRDAGLSYKMVTVAVPADHAPLLRIKAAKRASAIAEYYRSQGKNVLLIIDSLTRIAHAQREIGLALGEPPTMKGYPPSAVSLIPNLVERAGRDVASGGSVTAIYTVLADGNDLNDPIVDATRAITDGHIILSRELAESGVFPAIDIGKSISRVAYDIIGDEQKDAILRFRELWSCYQDNRDLITMGAYREGANLLLDKAIAFRSAQLAFLSQDKDVHVDRETSLETLLREFGQ